MSSTNFTVMVADNQSYTNSLGMVFKLIPSGTFMMGSPSGEASRYSDEGPPHEVTLTKSFYLQSTEVTQGQWQAVMGSNPSFFVNCGATCPVEQASWNDVQKFIIAMNANGQVKYRLPTEAEWEYAARAGTATVYSFGESASQLGDYAWFGDNASAKTHSVATKLANPWGLYDMHGNVFEWVSDWYNDYTPTAKSDPIGPASGNAHIFRGGSWLEDARGASWFTYASESRSAYRDYLYPDQKYGHLGFRLSVVLP